MSGPHEPTAPADEWDFMDDDLRPEEDLPAEEAALHEDDPEALAIHDPARREVLLDTGTVSDEAHFPDEDDGRPSADDGEVHDLEEMLEAQHYAFPAEDAEE